MFNYLKDAHLRLTKFN